MSRVNLLNIDTSLSADHIRALPPHPLQALYIHVPFCLRKCHYCDFYSTTDSTPQRMDQFVTSLLREAALWTDYCARTSNFDTVFFGGGTPTMLPHSAMQRLLEELPNHLPIESNAEWTVEANPATIAPDYLRMIRRCGVNRLSIGAQSFIESELNFLNRLHDPQAIRRGVSDAYAAGFRRISIDLMYAVPGQTPDSWQFSLDSAMALPISHLSCYCLTLEENTPLYRLAQIGRVAEVDESTQLSFMKQTRHFLRERGLSAYEISNYAHVGEECRHNLHYWRGDNYLSLGPGGASHIEGFRWRNLPNTQTYLSRLAVGHVPICDVEELSASQRAAELTMLGLRTSQGLNWWDCSQKIGFDLQRTFRAAVSRLSSMGLVESDESGMRLSDSGVYVADQIISELVRELN